MRRKGFTVLSILIAAIMLTSTVFAGAIKLSSVNFSLGSLVANGTLTGLGNQDVEVLLEARGFPLVSCTNLGGNQAPGQNPPKVTASGNQILLGLDLRSKNGKTPFDVATNDPPPMSAIELGCPNNNWTAQIDFIFWTEATISILDAQTGALLLEQDYTCTTTLTTVTCTPVR